MFCNRLPIISCFGAAKERERKAPSVQQLVKPVRRVTREPVILNVYDMFSINEYTLPLGLGIFHTGVEIYGAEYAYGGHSYPMSGIFKITPRNRDNELGGHFQYRKSIEIGQTHHTSDEVQRIIQELGHQYYGNLYHLTNRNCNHFSNMLTRRLCGEEIPGWVNRLANLVGRVPLLQHCVPLEWMSPSSYEEQHESQQPLSP